jgi:cytochrome c
MTGRATARADRYERSRRVARVGAILALLVVTKPGAAQTAAGPPSGESLFKQQCGTCHSVVKGDVERAGPTLFAVVGRTAGKVPGFNYSPSLGGSSIVWNAATLDRWLTDTNAAVPGSYMNYRQADAAKREQIIAYLASSPGNQQPNER